MTLRQKYKLWRHCRRIKQSLEDKDMGKAKAGIKSSEFWVALLGAAIPVFNHHLGLNIPADAVLGIVAIVISYIAGRSYVKRQGK